MKGRYIQLQGGKKSSAYMFDRKQLIDGFTNDGRYIPEGGVILGNGNLAGYLNPQTGGKTWTIIGKVDYNDPNFQYIPAHQNGGATKSQNRRSPKNNSKKKNKGGSSERPVSLKTAVTMLREYYRTNFN